MLCNSQVALILAFMPSAIMAMKEDGKTKRILMTDPAYVQQELTQIQSKLQEYEVTKSAVVILQTEVRDLKSQIQVLGSELSKVGDKGVTYVRWGRKDCPGNTTELVYTGLAGGSWYKHTGAAAEYVCLPKEPIWGPSKNLGSYYPALMYGAEYEDTTLLLVCLMKTKMFRVPSVEAPPTPPRS